MNIELLEVLYIFFVSISEKSLYKLSFGASLGPAKMIGNANNSKMSQTLKLSLSCSLAYLVFTNGHIMKVGRKAKSPIGAHYM